MQGKYCYGFYYDKQCCSPSQLPIENNKTPVLLKIWMFPPPPGLGGTCPRPPPGLGGTPYKSLYGDVPYVKLSFTSTS